MSNTVKYRFCCMYVLCVCKHVNLGCYSASKVQIIALRWFLESLNPPHTQGVLTQGPAHFCLPSSGILAGTTTFGFLCECSGMNSGPHARVAKHFPDGAISQAPDFPMRMFVGNSNAMTY